MILSAQKAKRKVVEQCYYCLQQKALSARYIVHMIGCPVVCRGTMDRWESGSNDGTVGEKKSSSDPTYILGYNHGYVVRLREEIEE